MKNINKYIFIYIHLHIHIHLHMHLHRHVHIHIHTFIEGSLEFKLPTIWTDAKAEVGRVREEKRRREKIRAEKE